MIRELEGYLVEITGYDAVSLQPNAGSQGEFAGLLAIKAYLESIGQPNRDICLIPSSAHGTNAASAVMAGMRVYVVACDEEGNVDVADLKAKLEQHAGEVAALMITYPSTHGVFESNIRKMTQLSHDWGPGVCGWSKSECTSGCSEAGKFRGRCCHLNLHKTFCIPHGGGGPGVGPVGVAEHSSSFLPSHPLRPEWVQRDGLFEMGE